MFEIAGQSESATQDPLADLQAHGLVSDTLAHLELFYELLPHIEAQLAPILAAHGLSTTSCPDDILLVEGLADELVRALVPLMRLRTTASPTLVEGSGTGRWGEAPLGGISFGETPTKGAGMMGRTSPSSMPFVGSPNEWGREARARSHGGSFVSDPTEKSLGSWGNSFADEGTERTPTLGCAEARDSAVDQVMRLIVHRDESFDVITGGDTGSATPPTPIGTSPCLPENHRSCTTEELAHINWAKAWLDEHMDRIPTQLSNQDYKAEIEAARPGVVATCNDCASHTYAFANLTASLSLTKWFM